MKFEEFEEKVCEAYSIKTDDLYKRIRTKEIVYARYVMCYVMTKHLNVGKSSAGRRYNLNPATTIHGINLIEKVSETNAMVNNLLQIAEREGVTLC